MIVILYISYLFKYLLHLILFICMVQGTHTRDDEPSTDGAACRGRTRGFEHEQRHSSSSFALGCGRQPLCCFWANSRDGRGWRRHVGYKSHPIVFRVVRGIGRCWRWRRGYATSVLFTSRVHVGFWVVCEIRRRGRSLRVVVVVVDVGDVAQRLPQSAWVMGPN